VNPVSHLLVGWTLANTVPLERRDRAIVTVAGIFPDVDGLGLVGDIARSGIAGESTLYWTYHHILAHNLFAGFLYAAVAFAIARRRVATSALAFVAIHLHILGDVAGSRGPDGYQWPIPYLAPFTDAWTLTWSGQWELNAWPNWLIACGLVVATGVIASKFGRSPLELVSTRADEAFIRRFRRLFGGTAPAKRGDYRS
jgi:inner membrane protein